MNERDSIDKIEEQIDSLLHANEDVEKSNETLENGDTKQVETFEDIKEEPEGDTKKIDSIKDLPKEKQEEVEPEYDSKDNKEVVEEDISEKENENDKKKKKKKIIFIISGIVILLVILLIVVLFLLGNHSKEVDIEKDEVLSSKEQKSIINKHGAALKIVIDTFYEEHKVLPEYKQALGLLDLDDDVYCSEHEIYSDGSLYLNKCSIDGVKTKYSYGKKQEKEKNVEISDDAIKVYVSKANKETTLTEPKNIDDYDVYSFKINGAYNNLELLSKVDGSYVVYADSQYKIYVINFRTGKKALDMLDYTSILPIKNGEVFDPNYVAVEMNQKWGVYKLATNERVIPHQYDSVTPSLRIGAVGPAFYVDSLADGIIAVENHNGNSYAHGLIDYRTGTEVIPIENNLMIKSGNYLFVRDVYGDGHIFDYYGKEYLKNDYDKIYWFLDGKYLLIKDQKNVKLIDFNTKELYDYGNVDISFINYGFINDDNNAEVFFMGSLNGSDNNSCIEFIYNTSNRTGKFETVECGNYAKPILYLYPKKTTKVTISFEHPEYLQTTYPKFTGEWRVTAHKNGDLYDDNNHYYYGLYWDEAKVHSVDFSSGFYVEGDNAIEFLEEKLNYIGLNRKEANEFIMYWLPILEKNEKSLVYFELTKERESYQKININPKPDSLLRVVIHVKKVDKKVNISEEKLDKFRRHGFSAVEWGGTVY